MRILVLFVAFFALTINTSAQTYQPQPFRLWDKVACFLGKSPETLTLKEYREAVQTVCTLADSSQHTGKAAQNAATARKFENCDSIRLQFASNIYQDSTEHLTSTDTASTEHLTSTDSSSTDSTQHLPTDTAQSIQHLSAKDNQPTNDSTEHLTSTDSSSTEHLTSTDSSSTEHLTSTDSSSTEHLTSTDSSSTEHLTSTDSSSTEHLTSTDSSSTEHLTFLPLRDALEFYRKKGYSPKAARAKVLQNIQKQGLQDSETGERITDAKTIKNYTKRIQDRKPAKPTANAKKKANKTYKRKPAKRKARSISYHVRKAKERVNLSFGFCLK